MPKAYQPYGEDLFTAENIRNCERTILSIQRRMDKAVADNDNWNKREYVNAYTQIHSVKMRKLYEHQRGKCLYCKEQISEKEIQENEVHIHHIKPVSFGGNNGYSNLRLLHTECHKGLHSIFTRQEMSELSDNKVDYINNRNKTISITNSESRVR